MNEYKAVFPISATEKLKNIKYEAVKSIFGTEIKDVNTWKDKMVKILFEPLNLKFIIVVEADCQTQRNIIIQCG